MDEDVIAKMVRVNSISPGTIQTPLTKQDTPEMEKAINDYVQSAVPMQRWGQADEVAKAVLFLASDDSSYMTGSDIMVDGGLGPKLYVTNKHYKYFAIILFFRNK